MGGPLISAQKMSNGFLFQIFIFISALLPSCFASKNPSPESSSISAKPDIVVSHPHSNIIDHSIKVNTWRRQWQDGMSFRKLCIAFNNLSMSRVSSITDFSETEPGKSMTRISFDFPRFESYGFEQAKKLSQISGLAAESIMTVLVKSIYRLLQFHIKRLFNLRSFEYAIPKSGKYHNVEWENNPEKWFSALLFNILPGVGISSVEFPHEAAVKEVYVRSFDFMIHEVIATFIPTIMGTPTDTEQLVTRTFKSPQISLYSLPPAFWNKPLPTGYTVLTLLTFCEEYDVMNKELLEYLLQGIQFAHVSNRNEVDIQVIGTDALPSIEESKKHLNQFFAIPIRTTFQLPKDIGGALKNGQTPKLASYHYDSFSSIPEVYEQLLTQIFATQLAYQSDDDLLSNWSNIAIIINMDVKKFLPQCKVVYKITELGTDELSVGKWDEITKRFIIYEEKRDEHSKHSLILTDIMDQQHLSIRQMTEINEMVFPSTLLGNTLNPPTGPIRRVTNALFAKLGIERVIMMDLMDALNFDEKEHGCKSKASQRAPRRRQYIGATGDDLLNESIDEFNYVVSCMSGLFEESQSRRKLSVDTILMGLTEIATRISATKYKPSTMLKVAKRMITEMNPVPLAFNITRLSVPADFLPFSGPGCKLVGTLHPMFPYPAGTIFAYFPDGRVVVTKRPLLFLPKISSHVYYIWFDDQAQRVFGNDINGSSDRNRPITDFFVLK